MKTQKDFMDSLHQNEQFKQAITLARSEDEKQAITNLVEQFVSSFVDLLVPVIERASKDPDFTKQVRDAIVEKQENLEKKG
jgi:hypothetical protein